MEVRPVGQWLGLPALESALVAWWMVGDLSEAGGDDQLLRLPLSNDVAVAAAVAGFALAGANVVWILRDRVSVGGARRAARLVATGMVLGVWIAFVLRVMAARTAGANIGGGMLMLVGPVVAIGLVLYAAATYRRALDDA